MQNYRHKKILYICGHVPCPAVCGAQLRIFNIGKLLQQQGTVRLVVIQYGEPTQEEFEATRAAFGDFDYFAPENSVGRGVISKIRRIVDLRWVQGRTETVSVSAQKQIAKLCADYDIIWIHTLAVADRLGRYSWPPHSVLDVDDLRSHKYKQEIRFEKGVWNKARAAWRMLLQARWEKDILNRFGAACVCSEIDRDFFKNDRRVFILPNGFEAPSEEPARNLNGFSRIGFIGTLSYPPNCKGLNWFIEKILPRIVITNPDVCLRVIGKIPDSMKLIQHPNVDYLGFVDDPSEEISTWSLSIVPLRVGGGTRIKVLESFSRMCPVVSTSVGAYGLEVENGTHLLICDEADEFGDACTRLLVQPQAGTILAKQGRVLLREKYTWESARRAVECVIEHCMAG
jgi:glycosyltransferase involved in cell wall biosynthesis